MGFKNRVTLDIASKLSFATVERVQPKTGDYVQEIFVLALVLQIVFLVGTYWKISVLTFETVFFAQFFVPAMIVVVASNWQRAIKYSLLSTLIIPGGTTVVLVLVAVVSFILKPAAITILKSVRLNIQASFTVWLAVLIVSLPAVVAGILVRIIWNRFRPNSKN